MANTTFTKTLSLMVYENNLTPDITDDYTLRVKTQGASLELFSLPAPQGLLLNGTGA